jgi:hypothetical protein
VTSLRRAGRIEQCWLYENHERPLRRPSRVYFPLRQRDLLERAAKVNGGCARAVRGAPRDRRIQRPIDFECRHSVAVPFELAAVPHRKPMTGNLQQRSRREIAQDRARGRQFIYRAHGGINYDLAAEEAQMGGKRIRQSLRASARKHPAGDMGERTEHQGKCRAR